MRVMLYSGGADSLALWYRCGKPVGVYVRIGSRYEAAELTAIQKQQAVLPDLTVEKVMGPMLGPLEQIGGRIPLRNMALITTALAATGADEVVVGFLRGEASPDKSAAFVRRLSAALSESEGRPIRVVAPAIRETKTQLLAWLKAEHPKAPLQLTVSCYSGDGKPCGNCQACFRGDVAKYLSGWSHRQPRLPDERAGAWESLRRAGVRRWPDLIRNNVDAVRALRGWR